jgi:hypothetical protein
LRFLLIYYNLGSTRARVIIYVLALLVLLLYSIYNQILSLLGYIILIRFVQV